LEKELRRHAASAGFSFEETVHSVIALGLAAESKQYRVQPVSLGGVQPGVDLNKALALADAFEDSTRA